MRLTKIQENIINLVNTAGSGVGTIAASIIFEGKVNVEILVESMKRVIAYNEAMRMKFVGENGNISLDIDQTDRNIAIYRFEDKKECKKWCEERTNLAFELIDDLCEFDAIVMPNHFGVYCKMHHVVGDAWSLGLIAKQTKTIYNALLANEEPDVEASGFDCFLEEEDEYYSSRRFVRDREFWRQVISEIPNAPLLSTKNTNSLKAERHIHIISPQDHEKIEEYCKASGISLFHFFMAGLGLYINTHIQDNEFFIGTTLLNRLSPKTKNTVGMCVNTAVVPFSINEDMAIGDYLKEVSKRSNQSVFHMKYPYIEVLNDAYENMGVRRQIYDVTLSYQPTKKMLDKEDDINVYFQKNIPESLSVDIFEEVDGSLLVNFDYNLELFQKWEVEQICKHYINGLFFIMNHDNALPLSDVEFIDEAERNHVLFDFNNTEVEYDRNKTIVHVFKETAEKVADRTAVEFYEEKCSYKELYESAEKIANFLRKQGIGEGDFVALLVDRSVEMIKGIWGILIAGAAYVPIDPNYPSDRVLYMINDCHPKAILVYGENGEEAAEALELDIPKINLCNQDIWNHAAEKLEIVNKPDSLAYMIYTSGTTGNPKGVAIEHMGLHNLMVAYTQIYELTDKDKILQVANYIFDQSVWDIFNILLIGGTLCLITSQDIRNPKAIANYCQQKGITLASFTPALLHELDPKDFPTFRIVDSSGESAYPDDLKEWSKYCRVINTYGPTEVTVNSSSYTYKGNASTNIPIGGPIANYQFYVLRGKQLCGVGMYGELCIAGDGVAREYYNQPELTEKAFVPNLFGKGKMYKTGDLVRWLPEGDIEYITRIDEQVKIRGYRIELGDIQSAIAKLDGVVGAVVMVKQMHDEKSICAYYIKTPESNITSKGIRDALRESLPDYMIPKVFVQMDKFPISPSGKINRRAFPEPDTGDLFYAEYEEATDEISKAVVACYKEVLGVEKVGIHDNFFELGGHSLKMSSLIHLVQEKCGVKVDIRDIFKNPTVEELSGFIQANMKAEKEVIPVAGEKEYYNLSPAQTNIYLTEEMNQVGFAYHMPGVVKIQGDFDVNRFVDAVNETIRNNDVLRAAFILKDNNPVQVIKSDVQINLHEEDLSDYSEEQIDKWIKEKVTPFDLEIPPLLHIAVGKKSETEWLLFIDIHHIISDGISQNLMIKEFSQRYSGIAVPQHRVDYCDYSEWMSRREWSEASDFWVNQLTGKIEVLDVPVDYNVENTARNEEATISISLDSETISRIKEYCISKNVTEYMYYLAATMITLSKHSGQDNIIVGSPIGGRTDLDQENMMGMFVNTMLMAGNVSDEKTWDAFLDEIKEYCLLSYEHQEYPYTELVKELRQRKMIGNINLLKCLFVMQNIENAEFVFSGLKMQMEKELRFESKFDIEFEILEGESYELLLHYNKQLYEEQHMQYMLKHYSNIVKQLIFEEDVKLGDVCGVSEDEIKLVSETFNDNNVEPLHKGVVEQIYEYSVKRPDRMAVVCGNQRMTYEELTNMADKLAAELINSGVTVNDAIPLLTTKSVEMIVGIVGIMRAGAAYVPIDSSYPINRIDSIVEDCGAKCIVTFGCDYENQGTKHIRIEDVYGKTFDLAKIKYPKDEEQLLAYMIYTSGSTGKPKGVVIDRGNLLNLELGLTENIYKGLEEQNVALIASYVFDASVKQIFMSICNGHTLHVIDDETKHDKDKMLNYICGEDINIFDGTPSYLSLIMDSFGDGKHNVKYVLSGGEKLKKDIVKDAENAGISMINVYGPTETTVDIAVNKCDSSDLRKISIGKPLTNNRIYISRANKLCGVGMPGEIVIVGKSVSRGYCNRPDLTEKVFVECPFETGIMYKTGDMGVWRADGTIDFIGRVDQQIKINGFRIELEEIEEVASKILSCSCVATVREVSGTKSICLYYQGTEIDDKQISEELAKYLPTYMIPRHYVSIDEIPYLISGKVDKERLPEIQEIYVEETSVAESAKEEILLTVFKEVLGRDQIGINDDFYRIGGDSIAAIRIVSKLNERNYSVKAQEIMMYQTIRAIAGCMKEMNCEDTEECLGEYLMTPIQKHFFERNYANNDFYNQSMIIKNKGRIQKEEFLNTLDEVFNHHDVLKSSFTMNSESVQLRTDGKLYDWYELDLSNRTFEDSIEEIQRFGNEIVSTIDIENGPLVKVIKYSCQKDDYILFAIHHLVVDAYSWRILMEDIYEGYALRVMGKSASLPGKTMSYKKWVDRIKEYSETMSFNKDVIKWKEVLKYDNPLFPEPREKKGMKNIVERLDASVVSGMEEKICKVYNADMQDVLLTIFSRAIAKRTGVKDFLVNVEAHGRDELFPEINVGRTVGWFTAIYPVNIRTSEGFSDDLISTKDTLRKIPQNKQSYGTAIYVSKDDSMRCAPSVCFNYLGNLKQESYENFKIVDICEIRDSADNNISEYAIECNCSIINDELKIVFDYQPAIVDELYIKDLLETMKADVRKYLSDNSPDVVKFVITASDYDEDLDADALEEIMNIF